jgi:hypothetical protein
MGSVRRTLASVLIVVLLLVPVASADRWQVIKTFTGLGTEGYDTDAFDVPGSEWQIDWSFKPNVGPSYLTVLAYPQGETGYPIAEVSGSSEAQNTSGTAFVHQGGGNYYLHVDAVNTLNYNVTVLYDTSSAASSGFNTGSAVIVLIAVVAIIALVAVLLRRRRK